VSAPFPPSRCCTLSVPARLTIVSALVALGFAALVVPAVVLQEAGRLRADLADRVERHLQFIVAPLAEHIVLGDYEVVEKMLAEAARRADVAELRWTDADGRTMLARGEALAVRAPDWYVRWTGIVGVERERAVDVGGRLYGRLRLTGSPAPALNDLWEKFLEMVEALVAGLGILLGMLLWVAQRALRPLAGLAAAARALGGGDRGVRVPEPDAPELAALAGAFNKMAADLDATIVSLKQANARNRMFATVVEQSHAAILTKDLDGRITSWNAAAQRIFGYSAEEVIGQPISILFPTGNAEEFQALLKHVRSARTGSREAERRAKDGSIVLIAAERSPYYDEDGRHVGEISVVHDITEKRRAERALFEAQERARVALDSITDGVMRLDLSGHVEYLNGAASRITGWGAEDALGRPVAEVFPAAGGRVQAADAASGEALPCEATLIDREGRAHAIEQSWAPLREAGGMVSGQVVVFRDVGKLRRLTRQLSWHASHDALTGLPNRRVFEERLRELVEDAEHGGAVHSLCYLDLDQFKVVNDTCGHVAGDEMLRQIAGILQPCLRSADMLARLGGDEFGMLLEHCPLNRAEHVAQKVLDALARFRFAWDGKTFGAQASIGIAAIEAGAQGATAILGAADAACFSAKEHGRNRVRIHRADDEELARRRSEMDWVSQVSEAISGQRIELWCQPIVPVIASGEALSHYEILVRMRSADGQVIPPMAFIPAAERYGLMAALDRRIVAMAFEAFAGRIASDARSAPPQIAINLSGLTIADPGFLGFVREQFRSHAIEPGRICFEITETAAVGNLSAANRMIAELKEMGCKFSLDDFGSGFSSFAYLKSLPVDYLKIDGSFVKDIESDRIDRAMVEAVNAIGHAMGIRTIAEFVENDGIRRMLATMGVDYAQGYGIGRPQPVAEAWAPRGTAVARVPLQLVAAG